MYIEYALASTTTLDTMPINNSTEQNIQSEQTQNYEFMRYNASNSVTRGLNF